MLQWTLGCMFSQIMIFSGYIPLRGTARSFSFLKNFLTVLPINLHSHQQYKRVLFLKDINSVASICTNALFPPDCMPFILLLLMQIVPNLRWFDFGLFNFYDDVKAIYAFSRKHTLNFDLPSGGWDDTLAWCWAAVGSYSSQSVTVIRVNNQYLYNHFVPSQPFCFPPSVQYSGLHKIFNTWL